MRTKILLIAAAALPASLAAQTTPPPSPAPEPQTAAPSAAPQAPAGTEQPAAAVDLRQGATVNDPEGQALGTIQAVTGQTVSIAVGDAIARVPKTAIRKNARGLVMSATRSELEASARERPQPH